MNPERKILFLLLCVFAFCFLPSARPQLSISPPADDTPPIPKLLARPVTEIGPTSPESAADASGDNLNDDNLETLKQRLKETKARLHAYENENDALRQRNELRLSTIRTLNESLAVSNAEREVFKRQVGDFTMKMEAFGLASVGDNKEALQQRLLKAVNDLRLLRDEKDKLADCMMGLSESVLLYLKTASAADPQLRLQIEGQIRAANEAVDEAAAKEAAGNTPVEGNLNDGHVISVKEEFSLVVVNLGRLQGVKIGTPFIVVRGDRYIGKARVVDVRERISGAVIEEYGSNTEKVKIGDTMRVDVQS